MSKLITSNAVEIFMEKKKKNYSHHTAFIQVVLFE